MYNVWKRKGVNDRNIILSLIDLIKVNPRTRTSNTKASIMRGSRTLIVRHIEAACRPN